MTARQAREVSIDSLESNIRETITGAAAMGFFFITVPFDLKYYSEYYVPVFNALRADGYRIYRADKVGLIEIRW